jgi:hypothetical protein
MPSSLVKTIAFALPLALTNPEWTGVNVECPATAPVPQLDVNYHECGHGFKNGSCEKFVEVFKQLLPRFDCQRSFDTSPVPALWLANSAAVEDYVHLLSHLNIPTAKHLFASSEFSAILDGALAEEYVPLSLKAERYQKVHGEDSGSH